MLGTRNSHVVFALAQAPSLVATALLAMTATPGCAPVEPSERQGRFDHALTGTGSGGQTSAPISYMFVGELASGEEIQETVRFDDDGVEGQQGAFACRAFLDGTEEQRRACDAFPENYETMDRCFPRAFSVGVTCEPRGRSAPLPTTKVKAATALPS